MEAGWGGPLRNAAGERPDLALVAVGGASSKGGGENSSSSSSEQRRWALRVGRSVLDCGSDDDDEGQDPEPGRKKSLRPPPPPLLLAPATAPGTAASPLTLLPSQARPFAALAAALSKGWMALLVGTAGSGKTSLARAAAAAARAPLVELSLAPSAVLQLQGDMQDGFRFFADLTRRLPAFRVHLSEDPAEIADAIGRHLMQGVALAG